MITDIIQLGGLDAYFQNPPESGNINLDVRSGLGNSRTPSLNRGRQEEISTLQLMLEGDDLSKLYQRQRDPLFRIIVMKEMFTGLFSDPHRHKVHNIAGFLDFNDGTLENGQILEMDGIPTIVSTGLKECKWVSKWYSLPDPICIDGMAWELATSKLSIAESFTYQIKIECFDSDDALVGEIITGIAFVNAGAPRYMKQVVQGVSSFRITFRAKVNQDSFMMERHLPRLNEKMGRPLLRAINVLELLNSSSLDIYSLTELQLGSTYFRTFETSDLKTKRIIATLDVGVVLVNSERQNIASDEYEFLEVNVLSEVFSQFEMKRESTLLIKNNGR